MFAGALRLIAVVFVAAVLAACQGAGGNPDRQSATPRPTVDATTNGERTADPDATDPPEATETPEATEATVETTEPDDEGEEVSVFDLQVGMCINLPKEPGPSPQATEGETAPPALYDSVISLPCSEPHEYEVFALVEHEAGQDEEYPGDREIDRFAFRECEDAFGGYVGIDYTESIYYLHTLPPSESTWADGDREAACLLYEPTEEDINVPREWTGSARDSEE